jgi:hypothetical protein
MASRNVPVPESALLVTVIVSANKIVAESNKHTKKKMNFFMVNFPFQSSD